jgi:hypothetical protein
MLGRPKPFSWGMGFSGFWAMVLGQALPHLPVGFLLNNLKKISCERIAKRLWWLSSGFIFIMVSFCLLKRWAFKLLDALLFFEFYCWSV